MSRERVTAFRNVLDGKSPEERKKFMEDVNALAAKHSLQATVTVAGSLPPPHHIFTEADFKHARRGAGAAVGSSKGGKGNAGKTFDRDRKMLRERERGDTIATLAVRHRLSQDGVRAALKRVRKVIHNPQG